MNKLIIIGNVGSEPSLRTVSGDIPVCSFSLAVNNRRKGEDETVWFKVTTWRKLAENCSTYLKKGSKVGVVGSVSVSTFTGNDGQVRASLEVNADEVEFLSTKSQDNDNVVASQATNAPTEFVQVDDEFLPF